jgi:hypothetical protein
MYLLMSATSPPKANAAKEGTTANLIKEELGAPKIVDRSTFQAELWHAGHPAPEQCEGCTWVTTQVRELSYIHSRDVTYATFCQGPYEESARYRGFMGWEMPWYSAPRDSLQTLLVGQRIGRMHIVCYLRQGSRAFETCWTTSRGVEVMDNNYHLLDLTAYGRQETWEDSPHRLATTVHLYADQQRLAHLATRMAGWTPHRSVAARGGQIFGRPGNRRALIPNSSPRANLTQPLPPSVSCRRASLSHEPIGASAGQDCH